jgi:hypothetical protein
MTVDNPNPPVPESTLVRVVNAVEELRQAVIAHAGSLDNLSELLTQIKGDS